MSKTFEYQSTVTIGETNLLQNMYFANHFKIQGVTRELWVIKCVENADLHFSNGLILITKSAYCDYKKDFYLYDDIICRMNFDKIKKASFDLIFTFTNAKTGEIHANGRQQIVFADSTHKICKMPVDFHVAAKEYKIEEVKSDNLVANAI